MCDSGLNRVYVAAGRTWYAQAKNAHWEGAQGYKPRKRLRCDHIYGIHLVLNVIHLLSQNALGRTAGAYLYSDGLSQQLGAAKTLPISLFQSSC